MLTFLREGKFTGLGIDSFAAEGPAPVRPLCDQTESLKHMLFQQKLLLRRAKVASAYNIYLCPDSTYMCFTCCTNQVGWT